MIFADPVAAAERTEAMVRALEGIGAAVESERAGEAFFAVDGLRGIHGGDRAGVSWRRRGRRAAGRIAVAPTRSPPGPPPARPRCPRRGGSSGFLAPLPVAALLRGSDVREREAGRLVEALERLGIETLEALARLSADQVADRFGPLGLRALRLARGEEEPLRPRTPARGAGGADRAAGRDRGRQLDRALGAAGRPPARGARSGAGGRCSGSASGPGSAAAAAGASSRGCGRPSASAAGPAHGAGAAAGGAAGAGDGAAAAGARPRPAGAATSSSSRSAATSRAGAGSARRCARCAPPQGAEALLKVLPVDAASRVPERWAMLTPFPSRGAR